MSVTERNDLSIAQAAYKFAWTSFITFPGLTPDERLMVPQKLRDYIDILVSSGETDSKKIALSALGAVREYEQIHLSFARIKSPSIEP